MSNEATKIVPSTGNRKPPNAGKGRPLGVPNKITGSVKEMLLGALEQAGGVDWLARQADENPVAFMSLLARLLPSELNVDARLTQFEPITEIRQIIVDAQHPDEPEKI